MIETFIESADLSKILGTIDVVILLFTCGLVEFFKTVVFKGAKLFKSLCPYITVTVAMVMSILFGEGLKTGALSVLVVKGLIDGGLAVLFYDSIVSKIKSAVASRTSAVVDAAGDKVDSILK